MKYLISLEVSLPAINESICFAGRNGNLEIIKLLVELGADVCANDNSAIEYAAMHDHIETVIYLMSHGAKFRKNSWTICSVAMRGYLKMMDILISNGVNIHYCNDWAVKIAIVNNNLDMVKFLISCGANIHTRKNSIILRAAREGKFDMLKYLISLGGHTRASIKKAIKLASAEGRLNIVDYLKSNLKSINTDDIIVNNIKNII